MVEKVVKVRIDLLLECLVKSLNNFSSINCDRDKISQENYNQRKEDQVQQGELIDIVKGNQAEKKNQHNQGKEGKYCSCGMLFFLHKAVIQLLGKCIYSLMIQDR
jgi:hypothetical protein